MTGTDIFSEKNDILEETAARLIKALGVETAIDICRSNYWHGVLWIIQEREASPAPQPQHAKMASTASPVRLHSLPEAAAHVDHHLSGIEQVALAA